MIFKNSTSLNDAKLLTMFVDAIGPYPTDGLEIAIRYSRRSEFSGTCFYETNRLNVNLGRHLVYPYQMKSYIARAVSSRTSWSKPLYTLELADGYQVVLFVLLHEYYHWMVKRAGRNTRQKESMCDRFAARVLVDRYAAKVRDPKGRIVDRAVWDFQDVEGFVAGALPGAGRVRERAARVAIGSHGVGNGAQLMLFAT